MSPNIYATTRINQVQFADSAFFFPALYYSQLKMKAVHKRTFTTKILLVNQVFT